MARATAPARWWPVRPAPARFASIMVAAMAVATAGIAIAHSGGTASGADQYAYVSQMDHWLAGALVTPMPLAERAPWPDAIATLTPYGYRPAPLGAAALVPVTAPGLPLLMAGFKWAGGHCAAFLVPPLSAALLVWCVFAIGRRVGGHGVALGAAWIAATSPVLLSMAKSTMSDVPAAAFWAASTWGVLGTGRASAFAAGAAASVAVLIRPNLVPLAAVLAAWLLWREWQGRPRQFRRTALFSLGVVPGCLAVAWYNATLYGSPLTSGYGEIAGLASPANVAPNLRAYGTWLAQTQTPLAWVGGLALLVAPVWFWPGPAGRAGSRLLGAVLLAVLTIYCLYTPFDAWWYLRFLLPAWPALCIGTATVVVRLVGLAPRWRSAAAIVALLGLGTWQARTAVSLDVYPAGEGERRYATVAQLVARHTEPSAVILTGQHVGSLRYYAGRLTLRYDVLDPAWLGRTLAWLRADGHPPYFLLEDWEWLEFTQRFGDHVPSGTLDLAPVLAYKSPQIPGVAMLFDPARPAGPTERTLPPRGGRTCVAPPPPAMRAGS